MNVHETIRALRAAGVRVKSRKFGRYPRWVLTFHLPDGTRRITAGNKRRVALLWFFQQVTQLAEYRR